MVPEQALATQVGVLNRLQGVLDAAQVGFDNADAAVALAEQNLDNLPQVEGVVYADVTRTPTEEAFTGDIDADFEGQPIAEGRVVLTLGAEMACFTIPVEEIAEEFCAPL